MEKLTIKITLNPKNYFDFQLIERLNGEQNMAGTIKGLAYERLAIGKLVIQTQPIGPLMQPKSAKTQGIEATDTVQAINQEEEERRERLEREVDDKLNRMFDKL